MRLGSIVLTLSLLLNSDSLFMEKETNPVALPVLMYHEVRYTDPGKDSVLPEEMESDLCYLAQEGYTTVLMEDVIRFVYAGENLPEKPILLTFDDGYGSNYRYLYPLLQKYRAKAVISLIGKSTDEFSLLPDNGTPYVHATWKQLLEMRDSGLVELQNHSYDLHRDNQTERGCGRRWGESPAAYEQRIRRDADRLQEELYEMAGSPASTFAYPYGCYDDTLEGIMEELGFAATLTCDFGVNWLTQDPDCLRGMKRICRSHGANLGALLEQALALPTA